MHRNKSNYKYIRGKRLGEGATAIVYECTHESNSYAMKVFTPSTSINARIRKNTLNVSVDLLSLSSKDLLLQSHIKSESTQTKPNIVNHEIDILKQLTHENIVRYVDTSYENGDLIIIMELMETTLMHYISKNREGVPIPFLSIEGCC